MAVASDRDLAGAVAPPDYTTCARPVQWKQSMHDIVQAPKVARSSDFPAMDTMTLERTGSCEFPPIADRGKAGTACIHEP